MALYSDGRGHCRMRWHRLTARTLVVPLVPMAYVVMAYVAVAFGVMACVVMALCTYGPI